MAALRRSSRATRANYTSFGRDYLAHTLGWPRAKLDEWLISEKVLPHLVFWKSTCVDRKRRYNEAIEWINTGFFYKTSDLEDEVILLCLEEGNEGSDKDAAGIGCNTYADQAARTFKWATIELWARSAWRIVQANCCGGDIFERAVKYHPAAAYGVAFDILSLAFHNIASVGPTSVWATIIDNASDPTTAPTSSMELTSPGNMTARQMSMDEDPESLSEDDPEAEELDSMEFYEIGSDSNVSDPTFVSEEEPESEDESESVFPKTPKKSPGPAGRRVSPKTPTKATRGSKRVRTEDVEDDSPSKKVQRWMSAVPDKHGEEQDANNMLKIFDQDGSPITGYRGAATMLLIDDEDTIVQRRDSAYWSTRE